MSLLYRTTDPSKWGDGKSSDLTPGEVDNNFWELAQRTLDLETNLPQPAEISNILVIGSLMTIYLSNGNSFGPFTLPYVVFRSRGGWMPDTPYVFMDLVTVAGRGLYFVEIAHTSEAEFDPDMTIGGERVYTLMFGESAYLYSFGFFYPMRPGQGISSGGYMAAHLFSDVVTLDADLPGSVAKLRVAPAADMTFEIRDDSDALLGDVTFPAGETDGVLTFSSEWTSEVGSYVYLTPPASEDASARDLMITIRGRRVLT